MTFRSAWGAAEVLGGPLFPWLLVGSAAFLLRSHSRLVIVAMAFPMAQSVATYVHLPHYFAAVAPSWFVLLGLAVERTARENRWAAKKTRRVAFSVLLLSVLPFWVLGEPEGVYIAQGIRAELNGQQPGIVFAGRSGLQVPHYDWAYNSPDLDDRFLIVNDGGAARNCEVWQHFPARSGWLVRVNSATSWTREPLVPSVYCAPG